MYKLLKEEKTYLSVLKEASLGDRNEPKKDWPESKKRKFYNDKIAAAKKHMKRAKETGNGGWQKMLKKRMEKYEAGLKSLSENLKEEDK